MYGSLASSSLPAIGDVGLARTQGAAESQRDTMKAAAAAGDKSTVRKSAEKFESQFVSQMLTHMFKGVKTDGMFGGGHAEGMWRDFYIEQVGDVIAKRGGIGIADTVERQLLQLQEVSR
jgi:Rod binding domain-containing protein